MTTRCAGTVFCSSKQIILHVALAGETRTERMITATEKLDRLVWPKRGIKFFFIHAGLAGQGRYHVRTEGGLRTIQDDFESVTGNCLNPLFIGIFFLGSGRKSQSSEDLLDAFASERRPFLTHTLPSALGARGTSLLNRTRSAPNLMCRACMTK